MNFNFTDKNLLFVEHRYKFIAISSIFILLGLAFLLFMGLNLGVDFTGGTSMEILINVPFIDTEVKDLLAELGHEPGEIRLAGNNNEIASVLFAGTKTSEEVNTIKRAFEQKYGADNISISESTVSASVARELVNKGMYALILAAIGIVVYVTFRFEYRFGIGAILSLIHDALFIISVFAILRLEVDLTFIAAILTVVGYSINDTIVIFDRIRENMRTVKLKSEKDIAQLVNRSIVETLPRSINTSLTVIVVALFLFIMGGEGIRNFSFALLIGLTAGTYSSIFIASQIWYDLKCQELRKKKVITS